MMITCNKCGKYSYGNKICYDCYQDEIKKYFVIIDEENNQCIRCKKNIKEILYCKHCYSHGFPLSPEEAYKKFVISSELPQEPKKYYKKTDEKKRKIFDSRNTLNKYSQRENKEKKIYVNSIKTKAGYFVKSKSEFMISNFLSENNIVFEYEKPFIYSKCKKPLKPDFYIPGPVEFQGRVLKDIYIEHFGGANSNNPSDQIKYNREMNYKLPIYRSKHITLICTYEEDVFDISTSLSQKLRYHKTNTINYEKRNI